MRHGLDDLSFILMLEVTHLITPTLRLSLTRAPCYWRPIILIVAGAALISVFWFTSRYPSLFSKASHLGQELPSMAYSSEALRAAPASSVAMRIGIAAINWLNSMKIGMTFGVLLGALLHTTLRYYPLKIGTNLYLNSVKGALIGVPMGVCANCAVPAACGVTRGNGRIEVALGFLFSSPNFNPVVIVMTFIALPLAMGVTKYLVLIVMIAVIVPALIRWLERRQPLRTFPAGAPLAPAIGRTNPEPCVEEFVPVLREIAREFGRNVWMLVKPTVLMMVAGSLLAAMLLTLVPWQTLLLEVTPLRVLLVSAIAVFMPIPIALDVMFASQLAQQGVDSGYVMLFAMTLGTFSIIPTIYLWRDVSRQLAVLLFAIFVLLGWVLGLVF